MPQWARSVLTHSDKGFCCVDAVWLLIWCLAGKSLFPRFGLSKECVAFSSPLEKRKGLRARVPQCTSWRARRYGTWPESLSDTWLPRLRGLSAQGCTLKRLKTNEDAATRREKVSSNERGYSRISATRNRSRFGALGGFSDQSVGFVDTVICPSLVTSRSPPERKPSCDEAGSVGNIRVQRVTSLA